MAKKKGAKKTAAPKKAARAKKPAAKTSPAAAKKPAATQKPGAAKKPAAGGASAPSGGAAGQHFVKEGALFATILPNHEARTDSPTYIQSRATLQAITKEATAQDFMYPLLTGADLKTSYQDHHGGGMWVVDETGWLFIKNIAGMEWSSQFCADPKKVDKLRQFAKRVYAKFPGSLEKIATLNKKGLDAAGLQKILDEPITDPAGVARWVDSVFNANVPLDAPHHTGFITSTKSRDKNAEPVGGVHHYPTPVTDIQFVKFDDFKMWVTDPQGNVTAVTPAAARGSKDGRLRVAYATPGSDLHKLVTNARNTKDPAKQTNILVKAGSAMAEEAFSKQGGSTAPPTPPPPEKTPPSKGGP